jgi:hypothetical protein
MVIGIAAIQMPDSKLAQEITEIMQNTDSPPLIHHSSRVYYWRAPRPDARCRAAVCRRDVSRHGIDASA